MKRVVMIAMGGLGLLLIAALIIPVMVPTSAYKGQIETVASRSLGVGVSLEGTPQLSILPTLSVRIDGVEIANPEGFRAPHLLKAGKMQIDLQIWPLLLRQIRIDRIILSDLDLNIEARQDGRYNLMLLAEHVPDETAPNTGGRATRPGMSTALERLKLRRSAISITGPDLPTPLFLTEFNGDARFTGLQAPLRARGKGTLNGQTFAFAVSLDTPETALAGQSAELNTRLDTDLFSITYEGIIAPNLKAPDASFLDGAFSLKSERLATLTRMFGDSLPHAVRFAKAMDIEGTARGRLNADMDLTFERMRLDAGLANIAYTGAVAHKAGKDLFLDGRYDLQIVSPKALSDALQLELPVRAEAVQRLEATGSIRGHALQPALDFDRVRLTAEDLDLSYRGIVDVSDTASPRLKGAFSLTGDRLEELLIAPSELIAALTMMGKIEASADIAGPLHALSLSRASLQQKSELLTTDFKGNISMAPDSALSGRLAVASEAPRALLATLALPLPEGETLQYISLDGNLGGTAHMPEFNGMSLRLDKMIATGRLSGDFRGPRPHVNADLTSSKLDLTPFLATTRSPQPQARGLTADWSTQTLDLAALKRLDGRLNLNADTIGLDHITLNDARLVATLNNGRLTAAFKQDSDTPGFRAFDGAWSGELVLDTSRRTPHLRLDAQANSIAARQLLHDLIGYSALSGIGDIRLNLTSEGSNMKALMNGLKGQFHSDLNEGLLYGINMEKLVREASRPEAPWRSGDMTFSDLMAAISPEAHTDFSRFVGNLEIRQGIATIEHLQLDNPIIMVTGTGRIDLGARSLDIRLLPSIDLQARGQGQTLTLESIPIPVKISGPWTQLAFGIDSTAVQAELTRRARVRAGAEIGQRIGGNVGTIIGGIVGGTQPSPAPARPQMGEQDRNTSPETDQQTPRTIEQTVRDRAVEGALGAIFGRQRETGEDNSDDSDG